MIFAMSPRAIFLLLGAAFAFVATPKLAFATPNGSDSGCSGKTGIMNDVCTSCGNCHAGGPVPSVSFTTAPSSLTSGATATFTVAVTTSLKETGIDIAATDGVVLTPGANTQNSFGELTQPAPQPTVGGTTSYSFTVTGPQYGGNIEIWVSGMGADGNGGIGGDGATDISLMVPVTGPPNPGGGGAVGSDAGSTTGPGPTGGFLPDGSAVDVDPPGVDLPDASANGLAPDDVLRQDSGACGVALVGAPGSNPLSGSGLLAAGLVRGSLFLTRRRRH
jgi:hypothetical protein